MLISNISLIFSSIAVAVVHTASGPDHYLPLVAVSKAQKFSNLRVFILVLICCLGHVGSSILIGVLGIALGYSIVALDVIESVRGVVAGYMILSFGLLYLLISLFMLNKPHKHKHLIDKKKTTFWALFIVFFMGPAEPIIPLLILPAASENIFLLITVILSFVISTLIVMLILTFLGLKITDKIEFKFLHKYAHIITGLIISFCGFAILVGF